MFQLQLHNMQRVCRRQDRSQLTQQNGKPIAFAPDYLFSTEEQIPTCLCHPNSLDQSCYTAGKLVQALGMHPPSSWLCWACGSLEETTSLEEQSQDVGVKLALEELLVLKSF